MKLTKPTSVLFEGAGHAFSNESNKENYRKDYAELAHQRAIQFFEKYLH